MYTTRILEGYDFGEFSRLVIEPDGTAMAEYWQAGCLRKMPIKTSEKGVLKLGINTGICDLRRYCNVVKYKLKHK